MPRLDELQGHLGYQFHNPALLQLALTHPSIAYELGGSHDHNQRLEYLGDAVLQLTLSQELYNRYPRYDEGPLTKLRAELVNQAALTAHARALGLGEQIVLSRGEQINGGRGRASILADAFEALVGALFLDGGYEVARRFILERFDEALSGIEHAAVMGNPKGALQEILQAISPEAPQYQTLSASGPDHDRSFECAVFHLGKEIGRGQGKSKKLAESQAATMALQQLRPQPKPQT